MSAMPRSRRIATILGLVVLVLASAAPLDARTLMRRSAILPGSVDRTSLALAATYDAAVDIDIGLRAFVVDAAIRVTNTSGITVDRLELNTAAARLGGLRLRSVTVDGRTVPAKVDDQTILVPLGGVLQLGGTTTVRVRYAATLRTSLTGSSWMFTRANGIVNAYRWLPWVSRATPFDRPNHGDPFVTSTSEHVRVTVTTDRPQVVAATGDRVSVSGDGLTQIFEARDVRDFTLTMAGDFRSTSKVVDGVTVRYYYRAAVNGVAPATIRDTAADVFGRLTDRLGPYPHATFKVVQSAGGFAMESPGLIWIPYGTGSANLRYLVAHETAHQWFYGLVGNDQAIQPFSDEAAADFAARTVTSTRRASRCSTGRLDLRIYDYSAACYYERIYIQGGNLLESARTTMGSSLFWSTLRSYIADQDGRLVRNRTLLDALDDATPKDLGALLFEARFPSAY